MHRNICTCTHVTIHNKETWDIGGKEALKDDQCALAQGTNELMGLCSVPNDHCGHADYISISILNATAGTGQDCAYSQTDIGPICCYGEHGVRTSGLCRHREGGGVGGGGDGGGGGRGGGGGDGGGAVAFLRAFMPFVYERHLLLWICLKVRSPLPFQGVLMGVEIW